MKLTIRDFLIISMAVVFCGGGPVQAQYPQLVLVTEPEPVVGFSESEPIQVRFTGVDQPIEGAAILFAPLSDTTDTYLNPMSSITNADGLAETMIMAGVEAIDFDVQISVPRDDGIVPLTIHVRIASSAGLAEAEYPGDFSSMQEAIDALADGGTLRIDGGVHKMEPTFIRGKTVHIKGAGPNCRVPGQRRGRSFGTVLVAPRLDRVTAPEEAQGSWHFVNAGGSVSDLRIIGGDAGIATRETGLNSGQPLTVSNTCISHTVRGIHHKAAAPLAVSDTVIKRVFWNGISISPSIIGVHLTPHSVQNVWIFDPENVCLYYENTAAAVQDDYLVNCSGGGIMAINSTIWVDETIIINAAKAGILMSASWGDFYGNIIIGTDMFPKNEPDPGKRILGDGIVALNDSTVYILESNIEMTERAAVSNYGSYVAIGDNDFRCQAMDLVGELYDGTNFLFDDLLNNKCGCPFANGPCHMESSSLAPPAPVGGLE